MKIIALCIMIFTLCACSTTVTQQYNASQRQQSVDLAVLSQNSAAILTAAAMPLHFYCQHQRWPQDQEMDLTQPVLTNLLALSYQRSAQQQLVASFNLLSLKNTMSHWNIFINKPKNKTHTQNVSIYIENQRYNIHLRNDLQFNCHPRIAHDHNAI